MTLRTAIWPLLLSLGACGGPTSDAVRVVHEVAHDVIARTASPVNAKRALAWEDYEDGNYAGFVAKMEQVAPESQLDVDLYNLACGYALTGDKEKAISTLAVVAERGQDYGMREDDDLASLRGDPRFEALADEAAMHEKASEYLEPYREMAMDAYKRGDFATFATMMEKISRWSADETDQYNLACGYALTGHPDEAIATLSLLADRGAHGRAATDSDFASIKDDPRFQAIIARPSVH